MSHRMDQEIMKLQRARQRLESASKEWNAAYRGYFEAMRALSLKTAPNNERKQRKHRSPKVSRGR
jgi:hypothetical protein